MMRILGLVLLVVSAAPADAQGGDKPIKVFILAGQSNMEGQAVVDLDGKNYNDGKGTLKALMNDPIKAPLFKHLKNDKGEWTVRHDVWVRYQREKQPLLAGPLSIGFSIYGGKHHFGPELQFGHVVGDHVRGQILLIKTAWGGKSLYKDFRPPSSGGEVGPYYKKMLAEIRLALDNLKTDFPNYKGQEHEFAGFVWYQGWNDGVDPKNAVPQYEENLVNLIKDVRKDLAAPKLPVVIGELTGPWVDAPGAWATLRKAQANAAERPEFKGNVIFVPTRDFVRPAKESPNPGHGHHEFGNAETYFLVGDALGKGMVKLLVGEPTVTGIRVTHRHGQTFVTWNDLAAGEEGAKFRYSVYRSRQPITMDNLKQAELCGHGMLNNSARLFGTAFNMKDRLDPKKPYSVIEEGGQPLPASSGLAVHTVRKEGKAFYAVVATDEKLLPVSRVVPGQSAMLEPIEETVAPLRPIKLHDSKSRGIYSPQTSITGQKGLPLRVELHASQGQGGGAGDYGNYYLYFATPEMGYRDGLPGVFSVEERREKTGNYLLLRGRDAIEHPSGLRAMETFWFGYYGVPQHATHAEPRAYPFTERRQDWIIDWVVKKYAADPQRISVSGGSMGAWGSTTYGLRQPERFAAVYPNRPRTRQRGLPSLAGMIAKGQKVLMDDGKTDYFTRMDMVKFAAEHPGDLPFFGWCCGRRDGFASWQEQIDMVKAMTAARHGFAFAWNDGDHSSGAQPMAKIAKYYPADKFARDRSYPAFANSSIDQKLGNGDPKDGDLEGGINLGFVWKSVVDEKSSWAVTLANDLAKAEMTVDVTPRRCQQFKPPAGAKIRWTTSLGSTGTVVVDAQGLITVPRVVFHAGKETALTLRTAE